MEVALAYDHRTTVVTAPGMSALDIATNRRRTPVSFTGRVKAPHLLRQLLLALHQVIVSDQRWYDENEWRQMLDPVITVHHDQLFFEAFSNDQSSYVRLSAPLDAFEAQGDVRYGTTNIDFTWQLREALLSLRSSRQTMFSIGPTSFAVATEVGAAADERVERKVDVPEGWLKGFLQVQSALTMHPFLFDVKPVDLLSTIAFVQDNKPPSLPHGLRFEFVPNEPITAVLEPWDQRFVLRETHYTGYQRTVRLWGRRRLELLQGVLPYAETVTIGVLGRGMPHFYICQCGPFQFTLVLSGWSKNDWSKDSAFDALAPRGTADNECIARVYAHLGEHLTARRDAIGSDLGMRAQETEQALFALCRAGRVMYDPTTGQYRNRDLFAEPLDVGALFAPDPRSIAAQRLLAAGKVRLHSVAPPERREDGRRETRAEASVTDGQDYDVLVSVDTTGRLRFGKCACPFFQSNLMSRGPCEHILAACFALDQNGSEDSHARDETADERAPF
ncbi:MAG TPA: SWIM zinc finger family protein [Ktedonobacterales bacterium]|jgi:predicted nucleic acid-binding Zn finger protein|nr:SWIM zinc finger family protein [Ktedonobacterales bacterium]